MPEASITDSENSNGDNVETIEASDNRNGDNVVTIPME